MILALFSELNPFQYLLGQPGGPAPSMLPKAQSNVAVGSPPSAHFPDPAEFLNALTNMQGMPSQVGLRQAQTGLYGTQADLIKAQIQAYQEDMHDQMPSLYVPGQAKGEGGSGGGQQQSDQAPTIGGLIKQHESAGNYNVGFGGTDLSKAPLDETGFPIWEGKEGPAGISHAAGAYQFEPALWHQYAPMAGVKDFSPASQDAVFHLAYLNEGVAPWANFNPKLRAALGDQAPPPNADQAAPVQVAQNGPMTPGELGAQIQQRMSPAVPNATPATPVQAAQNGPMSPGQLGTQLQQRLSPGGASLLTPPPGQQINPDVYAWAQRRANRNAILGRTTPDYVAKLAEMAPGMPESIEYQANVAGAKKENEAPFSPIRIPQGAAGLMYNPNTRAWELGPQVPKLPEGATYEGGQAVPVPGALPLIGKTAAAQAGGSEAGKIAAEQAPLPQPGGALPSTPGMAPPIPSAAAPPIGAPRRLVTPAGVAPGTQPPDTQQPRAQSPQPMQGTPIAPNLTSVIPPVNEPPMSAQQLASKQPEWTKQSAEMVDTIGQSQLAEHQLTNVANAMKIVQSGALTEQSGQLNALLKGIFGQDTSLQIGNADPAQIELALHENGRSTIRTLSSLNKRFANAEFQTLSAQAARPGLQPEANYKMLVEDIGTLRQMRAEATDWLTYQRQGGKNPEAFETQWLAANPLNKIVPAVESDIGPLKGMRPPGAGAGSQSNAAPAQSPQIIEGSIGINPTTGHKIIRQGGNWIDTVTGQPFQPPTNTATLPR